MFARSRLLSCSLRDLSSYFIVVQNHHHFDSTLCSLLRRGLQPCSFLRKLLDPRSVQPWNCSSRICHNSFSIAFCLLEWFLLQSFITSRVPFFWPTVLCVRCSSANPGPWRLHLYCYGVTQFSSVFLILSIAFVLGQTLLVWTYLICSPACEV